MALMDKITTFAQLKERKKPIVQKVWVALDDEKADEFNKLAGEYRDVKMLFEDNPTDRKLKTDHTKKKAEYDEAVEQSADFLVEFAFRSIGRKAFEELLSNCPPTEGQKKDAMKKGEDEPAWNPDTFMPSLLAASIVTPEISEEEMFEMWESEDWNMAELTALFLAAIQVNQTRKVVDLGKGSGQMFDFGLN